MMNEFLVVSDKADALPTSEAQPPIPPRRTTKEGYLSVTDQTRQSQRCFVTLANNIVTYYKDKGDAKLGEVQISKDSEVDVRDGGFAISIGSMTTSFIPEDENEMVWVFSSLF